MSEITARLSTALADRYKIERHLGEGGMANVYLAEDLKHKRKVAVKVLRPELAAVLGAERFVQEITTTANLQHPHILPLFDSGEADGFLYYVMPFIEGETLRDKLNRETQLGIDEAVKITTEVADALDYAHRNGVIHRDIKPENILLHDGRPMVADFGIALAVSAAAGGRMTETGLSLGTPHYMSPEQATAEKNLTNRSDIYSLGSVLYEMLTAEPPHLGGSAQAIIMKIVTEVAPPVTAIRKSVPPNIAAAVGKALEKLPADRFESAKTFAEALADPGFTTATVAGSTTATTSTAPTAILATIAAVAALLAAWGWLRPTPDADLRAMSVQIGLPEGYEVHSQPGGILALSPDGSRLAVVGRTSTSDVTQLFVRPLDATRAEPVPGSEGASNPVWSPSGDSLAFIVGNEVRVASLLPGGRVATLTSSAGDNSCGTSWSTAGEIAFVGHNGINVLRVADGAEEEFLTGDESVCWPHWVPGRRRLTFTHYFSSGTGVIGFLDVETGEQIDSVTVGFNARVTTSGHLVWSDAEATVWAAPVDTEAGRLEGAPVAVMNDVAVTPGGGFRFALARSGDVSYIRRTDRADRRLVVVTVRTGDRQEIRTPDDVALMSDLDLSPDGSKVAYSATQFTSSDVWITDVATGSAERFSDRWQISYQPVWTPGGERLLYTVYGSGLVWRPIDKSSPPEVLTHDPVYNPSSWSADGTVLLGGQDDLWALYLPDSVPTFLSVTEGRESMPALSPDGRWLAYVSDRDGSDEIWVQTFEGEGGPWKVSEGGGWTPTWSASGDRLYFRTRSAIMASNVAPGPTFVRGSPTVVLASAYPQAGNSIWWEKSFDVFPDEERIVLYEQSGPSDLEVTYETRWVQRMLEDGNR